MNTFRLVALLAICLLISETLGHSYLTKPTSRSNQKNSVTGCRGPGCLGPCDVANGQGRTGAVTIGRGAKINVNWPRNNHAGGFIRFAWSKTSDSDSHTSFDNGVQEIHCHEIGGCKPDDPNAPNGGDSAPTDGSFQPCAVSINVPTYLTDGAWTLQWSWFGGAFQLGDYYSCVDYIVSGGAALGTKQPALFYGGDYTYPGQNKCKFFNTDRLHQCVNEPCSNPVYTASQERSGPAYGVAAAGASSTSTSSPPPPVTTKAVPPVTTKALPPVTTKAVPPVTTQAPAPVTTKAKATPTPSPTPSPDPTPTGNCVLGYEECVGTNTYKSCYRISANTVSWSPARSCQPGLICKKWLDNYVICDRP